MKRKVTITESKLRRMVSEATKRALRESEYFYTELLEPYYKAGDGTMDFFEDLVSSYFKGDYKTLCQWLNELSGSMYINPDRETVTDLINAIKEYDEA